MSRRSILLLLSWITTACLLFGGAPLASAQACVTSIPAGNTAVLIASIACANGTTASETLTLGGGTYTLSSIQGNDTGLPPIVTSATAGSLTLNGGGSTIARSTAGGTPLFRLMFVQTGGSLTLNNLTLRGGDAGFGSGGAIASVGALTLNAVTLTGNTATTGGALRSNGGTVVVRDSTISGNTAAEDGGGIVNDGVALWVINSTISGNQVTGTTVTAGGGAIYNRDGASLHIISSTIAYNTAVAPNIARSGIWIDTGTLTVQNSIVSNHNGPNNCVNDFGTIVDAGGNIDSGTTCGFGASSLSSTNPLLDVLSNNTGPTHTHALAPNSPAIDAGVTALAVDENGAALTTDQRGGYFGRVAGLRADSGAVEFPCFYTYPYTVPAGDVPNLVKSILCARGTASSNTINLTQSTYTLTAPYSGLNGLPKISFSSAANTLTINGNGATITRSTVNGTPDFRLFEVESDGDLRLNDLTLTNGRVTTAGGGAIASVGTLSLTAVTISGSHSEVGGAIDMGLGVLLLRDSTLANNSAIGFGSAFFQSGGTARMINSTISGNQITDSEIGNGGAISLANNSTLRIINSTIAFNFAPAPNTARSGIVLDDAAATVILQNSIVSDNGGANNCAIEGTLTDNGGNIDSDTTCGFGVTSLSNAIPHLLALADNGGPTYTHALTPNSPAIDRAIPALAVDHTGAPLTTDQRGAGFPRSINARPDSGAYEMPDGALTLTLTQEGRGAAPPTAAHIIGVQVLVRTSPGGVLLYGVNGVSTSASTFTLIGLEPGTYEFHIKGSHTLAVVQPVTIGAGGHGLVTSLLREGDSFNDNVITISDFSLLAAAFGRAQGQVFFDTRADFNGDNVITIADFSLMAANFGIAGAP